MSVRRKGPKATAIRVATYVLLVCVAVVVVFPFAVAVTTSFKRNTDIFTYPPSLIPKKEATIPAADVGLEGDPVPVYTFPDRDDRPGQWALVDGDASLAEFRPLDDLERVIVLDVKAGEKTGETITIDGEEEDVYLVDDGGAQVEAYRSRLTSGGLFVSVDDPSTSVLDLVNFATPAREFGPRFANFTEVLAEKDPETNGKGVGRSLTNTVLVTILVVLGQIITSILGGYAFARVQFKGRSTIFLMYLGSVMIPFVVLIIPLFQLMLQVNWRDNLVALIIPFAFTAYGTFLMRQFFLGIPAGDRGGRAARRRLAVDHPLEGDGAAGPSGHRDARHLRLPLRLELVLLAARHHQLGQPRQRRAVAHPQHARRTVEHRHEPGVRGNGAGDDAAHPRVPLRTAILRRELRLQRTQVIREPTHGCSHLQQHQQAVQGRPQGRRRPRTWRSPTASSWCSSARRGAASRPRCG